MEVILPHLSDGWLRSHAFLAQYLNCLQIKAEMAHRVLQATVIFSCGQRLNSVFCFLCRIISLPSTSLLPQVEYTAQHIIHNFICALGYITQSLRRMHLEVNFLTPLGLNHSRFPRQQCNTRSKAFSSIVVKQLLGYRMFYPQVFNLIWWPFQPFWFFLSRQGCILQQLLVNNYVILMIEVS